jgi:hypothetical protein
MSSLIDKGRVLDCGDIVETADAWVGANATYKAGFPAAFLIQEEPPYASEWRYENGVFVDMAEARAGAQTILSEAAEADKAFRTPDQAESIRRERNEKLAASDWTQAKDIPDVVSAPWAAYRQELREVPAQEGFPWGVTWPKPPG